LVYKASSGNRYGGWPFSPTVVLSAYRFISVCKSIVWLMLGALAEIPPVVRCSTSYTSPLVQAFNVQPCSTMQVLIFLNLNGSPFFSITYR
jgi:hypothetical protein